MYCSVDDLSTALPFSKSSPREVARVPEVEASKILHT
jgi:hypothetical protein